MYKFILMNFVTTLCLYSWHGPYTSNKKIEKQKGLMTIAKTTKIFIYWMIEYTVTWTPFLSTILYKCQVVHHGFDSWWGDLLIYLMPFCICCPLLSPWLDNYQGWRFSIDFHVLQCIIFYLAFITSYIY